MPKSIASVARRSTPWIGTIPGSHLSSSRRSMEPNWPRGVSIVAATLLFSGALTGGAGCTKRDAPATAEQSAAPVASSDGQGDKKGEAAATAAPAEGLMGGKPARAGQPGAFDSPQTIAPA